ncbi:galactokinase-like protein [Terfezia boudieri ATCC MYA-4762]|uniref:Galactokinase n=1 Tax=Terfezia boudieri ATCC MYA-4762 TaxID=1051890 RepID=A0A3N4LLV8_9PEZI|nr:galactokinase-like protein [Terfezia boudieri ATCC MYA-4762]
MAEPVPLVSSPNEVYPEAARAAQAQRWEHLESKFLELYGRKADFISRSPGRVNIIGEHIDYMLYEVLPMAVTVDVLLAVSVSNFSIPTVRITNVNSKFGPRTFELPPTRVLEIDSSEHEWSNYFKAGLRGAIELLRKKGLAAGNNPVGMDILVDGTVPSGAGLSSSAALVCASALASLVANGEEKVDKKELVNLAVVSERYVGVNSGGMDQSASVLGLEGNALYIKFKPSLDAKPVSFPKSNPELTFVIAKSFVQADKHTTGPVNYNLRVVECTLAATVLAKKHELTLPEDNGPLGSTLRGFQDTYFAKQGGTTDHEEQLQKCIDIVKQDLSKDEGYTIEEITKILGISIEELTQKYMTRFPIRAERFQLRNRALHVFTESLRVFKFMHFLDNAPTEVSREFLQKIGNLMNESQTSCRDLFDCSCPELDVLCDVARAHGSYGSRLTGAGWGGCSIHLLGEDKVDEIRRAWKTEYYDKYKPGLSEDQLGNAIVVSKPGSGAVLYKVLE